MSSQKQPEENAMDAALRQEASRRSRRGFLVGGIAALAGYGVWREITHAPEIDQLSAPLRKTLQWNASVSRHLLGESGLAPTFSKSKAVANVRVNGDIGIDTGLIADSWRLKMVGLANPQLHSQYVPDVNAWDYKSTNDDDDSGDDAGDSSDDTKGPAPKKMIDASKSGGGGAIPQGTSQGTSRGSNDDREPAEPGVLLTLEDLRKLPHVEMVTQLKCIEGWSEIVHWGGVRFGDLIDAYKPAGMVGGRKVRYAGLETPDGNYYVGLDMSTAMHPQTLLCYEINGKPLTPEHGAPLRLATPLKYGIKQLKQVGTIRFASVRPKDYWAEQGYDWYVGH